MARGFTFADGASPEVVEAGKPFLHRATLVMHAQSKNALVREIIARRDDLPFGLMVTLAHDSAEDVRAAVAANPTAMPAVLDHLATDRSVPVLFALISNASLQPALLESLLFHRRQEVRNAAASRLDLRSVELVPELEDEQIPELRDVSAAAGSDGRCAEASRHGRRGREALGPRAPRRYAASGYRRTDTASTPPHSERIDHHGDD